MPVVRPRFHVNHVGNDDPRRRYEPLPERSRQAGSRKNPPWPSQKTELQHAERGDHYHHPTASCAELLADFQHHQSAEDRRGGVRKDASEKSDHDLPESLMSGSPKASVP